MDIFMEQDEEYVVSLLQNVHLYVEPPSANGKTYLTQGNFTYYHYKCDNYNDVGWGCGYRTLQSLCSWVTNVLEENKLKQTPPLESNISSSLTSPPPPPSSLPSNLSSSVTTNNIKSNNRSIPSITEIQTTLVNISDKPQSFFGSKDWIGTLEVFYVIDALYDVPCKILHIPQSEDLKKYANIIQKYFEDFGGFVMMGGDVDASSKGIAGIHISGNQAYFLVIDPHFIGTVRSPHELVEKNYVRWQHTSQFVDSSFYNLCLPQVKLENTI